MQQNIKWSPTEDRVLRQAVQKYGSNQWNRVASLLSSKNAAQCRERWLEVLNPRLSQAPWSASEDALLLELAKRMPQMWRSISSTLGGRSAAQCFERHEQLVNGREAAPNEVFEESEERRRELLAEAGARLANSLGRKAKRKQRERLESDQQFEALVEQNRHLKRSKYLNSPQVDLPEPEGGAGALARNSSLGTSGGKHQQHQRREPLVLSPPAKRHEAPKFHELQHLAVSAELSKQVSAALDKLPPPRHT